MSVCKSSGRRSRIAAAIGVTVLVAGCGGGGSSGTTGGTSQAALSVNLSGAVSIQTLQDTVVEESSETTGVLSGLKALFTKPTVRYRVSNQGTAPGAPPREVTATGAHVFGHGESNVVVVYADGSSNLAISSKYDIKIMYTVTDPAGEYIYLALDSGWWTDQYSAVNLDYTGYIVENNCAIVRVPVGGTEPECVAQGLLVQDMQDKYVERVSVDRKPIQFDSSGNVYFSATRFSRSCQGNNCSLVFNEWRPRVYRVNKTSLATTAITQDNDRVQFYLVMPNGEVVFFKNEDCGNDFFCAGLGDLRMYLTDGSVVTLSNQWGVDFFAADEGDTVMWNGYAGGSAGTAGIRFARPNSVDGGAYRATLETTLFKPNQSADPTYSSIRPRRIIVGDDGKLYGAFEGYNELVVNITEAFQYDDGTGSANVTGDLDGDNWICDTIEATLDPMNPTPGNYLRDSEGNLVFRAPVVGENFTCAIPQTQYRPAIFVYQMLPYDGSPKAVIDLGDFTGEQIMDFMKETPFQIAGGYLFYREQKNEPILFGNFDLIKVVRLEDRAVGSLFNGDVTSFSKQAGASRKKQMEVFSWRVASGKLYFTALDLQDNKVKIGTLNPANMPADLAALDSALTAECPSDADDLDDEFLCFQVTSEASGAASRVRDIEIVEARAPVSAPGVQDPVLNAAPENVYSLSLEFNEDVNRASVLDKLSVTKQSDGSNVDYIPVWIGTWLHLIVDTDGLLNPTLVTAPMQLGGAQYDVAMATWTDATGDAATVAYSDTFTTKKKFGWYWAGGGQDVTGIAEGGRASFSRPNPPYWDPVTGTEIRSDDWNEWRTASGPNSLQSFRAGSVGNLELTGNSTIEFSARNLDMGGMWMTVFDPASYAAFATVFGPSGTNECDPAQPLYTLDPQWGWIMSSQYRCSDAVYYSTLLRFELWNQSAYLTYQYHGDWEATIGGYATQVRRPQCWKNWNWSNASDPLERAQCSLDANYDYPYQWYASPWDYQNNPQWYRDYYYQQHSTAIPGVDPVPAPPALGVMNNNWRRYRIELQGTSISTYSKGPGDADWVKFDFMSTRDDGTLTALVWDCTSECVQVNAPMDFSSLDWSAKSGLRVLFHLQSNITVDDVRIVTNGGTVYRETFDTDTVDDFFGPDVEGVDGADPLYGDYFGMDLIGGGGA